MRKSINDCRLYLILDSDVAEYDRLFSVAKESIKGGVDVFQWRDKSARTSDSLAFARKLRKMINPAKALFIVNDRVDLALAAQADGVHLGQDDLPLIAARKILPPGGLVGISCQTLEHSRRAQRQGADYIGFGSVFKTLTKPGRVPMDLKILRTVVKKTKIPLFAIGGITALNIQQLTSIGVRRVAVCRDICLARDVRAAASDLKKNVVVHGP